MGLFLAMSAVVGSDIPSVERALVKIARDHDGIFEPATAAVVDDDATAVLGSSTAGTTVVYPNGFTEWDDASRVLSAALRTSVFSLHIHDGDLWMFLLFTRGEQVAQFNTVPGYWGRVEPADWLPDPSIVAAVVPGADPAELAPYLQPWDDDAPELGAKVWPGDEFGHGRDWQLIDFMRRLGFDYPSTRYRQGIPLLPHALVVSRPSSGG